MCGHTMCSYCAVICVDGSRPYTYLWNCCYCGDGPYLVATTPLCLGGFQPQGPIRPNQDSTSAEHLRALSSDTASVSVPNALHVPIISTSSHNVETRDKTDLSKTDYISLSKESRVISRDGHGRTENADEEDHRRVTVSFEDLDGCDIESFKDSAYGTASETSEITIFSRIPEARECLLNTLVNDRELRTLFSSVSGQVSRGDFQGRLQAMLTQLSRDLRKDAQTRAEHSVAYLAQTSSGFLENSISSIFFDGPSDIAAAIDALQEQLPQKRELLERLLTTQDIWTSSIKTASDDMELREEIAAEEAHITTEEEHVVNLPRLSRLEEFITESRALQNLRDNVGRWLNGEALPGHSPNTLNPDQGRDIFTPHTSTLSVENMFLQVRTRSDPAVNEETVPKNRVPRMQLMSEDLEIVSRKEQIEMEPNELGLLPQTEESLPNDAERVNSWSSLWLWLMSVYSPPQSGFQRISYICVSTLFTKTSNRSLTAF